MPLLTPNHRFKTRGGPEPFTSISMSYRGHALAYPQPQISDTWWSRAFHLYIYVLQGACPCLPPTTDFRHVVVQSLSPLYLCLTGGMPLLTPNHRFQTRGGPEPFTSISMSYRGHALANPQPQISDTWWSRAFHLYIYVLQGACPCLPQTTDLRHVVVQSLSPLYLCLTGGMPLLTPNHRFQTRGGPEPFTSISMSYRGHALAYPQPQISDTWWSRAFHLYIYVLQGACPCLPPTTDFRHVVVQSLSPLYLCLTGGMPLLTPNHRFKTRGGPEPFTSISMSYRGHVLAYPKPQI